MARKALVIIEQDKDLQSLINKLDDAEKDFNVGLKFLEKQRSDLWDKTMGAGWSKIESHLIEKGLLEGKLDTSKSSLQTRSGVLYLIDKDDANEHPLSSILGSIFNKE